MTAKKLKVTIADIAIQASKGLFKSVDIKYIRLVKKIMLAYAVKVSDEIMNGFTYKIPMRLGFLKIVKSKGVAIDWRKTVELRKKIVHKNFNSDGYIYRWKWSKTNYYAIFTNKSLYSFAPVRRNKRKLSQILKTEYREYSLA